jgi:glutamine amidotransferase PdxT
MKHFGLGLGIILVAVGIRAEPAPGRRDVYVLKSSGVCEGCAEAISRMLFSGGIRSQILGPEQLKQSVHPRDVLVIGGGVPGGEGEWTIKQDLVKADAFDWLKQHIAKGGRYVGICAGAYLAEKWIDEKNGEHGLDIFPGAIDNLSKNKSSRSMLTHWNVQNIDRWVYFQDGPSLIPDKGAPVTVLATFAKQKSPAAVVFAYGQGLVELVSPHLEASEEWFREDGVKKPDGTSYDLGLYFFNKMIDW